MILNYKMVGFIIMGIFGVLGWIYGAVKIPTIAGIAVTKKVGGESLDEIINRYIKFKAKRRIYSYADTILPGSSPLTTLLSKPTTTLNALRGLTITALLVMSLISSPELFLSS